MIVVLLAILRLLAGVGRSPVRTSGSPSVLLEENLAVMVVALVGTLSYQSYVITNQKMSITYRSSLFMRFETDGRALTIEDACLRAKVKGYCS
jgi:hypothetical protein